MFSRKLITVATLYVVASTQSSFASTCTELFNSDFDEGTYIIDQPGCYKLMEDVAFEPRKIDAALNPNHPEKCLFPDLENGPEKYKTFGFSLGFFAAISIQADNVNLDLNTHTLMQSDLHALCQRFFALIELASAPFPPGGGPADFASDSFSPATNVKIVNGRLGQSSHHGIHGNNNNGVLIRDVVIENFEVAGISLNAVTKLRIDNVKVGGTRTNTPANGRLSQAIFLLQAVTSRLSGLQISEDLVNKTSTLQSAVFDFISTGSDNDGLFASHVNGVPDASMAAGIIVHNALNVGSILKEIPEVGSSAHDIILRDVLVKDIVVSPGEKGVLVVKDSVATNSYTSGTHVHDNVGAVFDVDFVLNTNDNSYKPNPLTDLQVAIGEFSRDCLDNTCFNTPEQEDVLKRNTISQSVADWTHGLATWADVLNEYDIVGNADVMFHANKGAFGIKLDGNSNVVAGRVEVENIKNLADSSRRSRSAMAFGDYVYTGEETRGISVAASMEVIGFLVDFERVESTVGTPICLDFMHQGKDLNFHRVSKNHPDISAERGSPEQEALLAGEEHRITSGVPINTLILSTVGSFGAAILVAAAMYVVHKRRNATLATNVEKPDDISIPEL